MTTERPLRIVHVSTFDHAGGAEKAAWKLHKRFLELGHDSILVVGTKRSRDADVVQIDNSRRGRTVAGLGKIFLELGLGVQYLDYPGSHRIPELVTGGWDVAHLHNLHGGYFDVAAVERLTKVGPTVVTLQDMWLLTGHCAHPCGCERWAKGCGDCCDLTLYPAVRRDATRYNRRRKERLLTDVPFVTTSPGRWLLELAEETFLGSKRLLHMPNPVDTRVFRPGDRADARASLGLPQDRPIVLFPAHVGLWNTYKDPSVFLDAIAALEDRNVLGLAFGPGEGPRDTAVRLVPSSRDETEMATYYQACDVVAQASRAETAPLAILEAFACARPVVGTRVGGIPELVDEGETGLLAPPGDAASFAAATRQLLEAPERAAAMGAAGLERARTEYDLSVVADRWIALYRELQQSAR